jgi:hypothetical protein
MPGPAMPSSKRPATHVLPCTATMLASAILLGKDQAGGCAGGVLVSLLGVVFGRLLMGLGAGLSGLGEGVGDWSGPGVVASFLPGGPAGVPKLLGLPGASETGSPAGWPAAGGPLALLG